MNIYLRLNEKGDEIMSSIPFSGAVSTEDSNDELIRKRAFKISDSIELADILIPSDTPEIEQEKDTKKMISLFINLITASRMILGLIIFVLLTRTEMYWIAFWLFFIASISDYFDGYLARKYNSVSQLGEILDPIADKILIVFLLFAISINLTSKINFA